MYAQDGKTAFDVAKVEPVKELLRNTLAIRAAERAAAAAAAAASLREAAERDAAAAAAASLREAAERNAATQVRLTSEHLCTAFIPLYFTSSSRA